MILRCSHIGPAVWKNGWMIHMWAPSSDQVQRYYHSALWVFSSSWVYISCTLVNAVHYGIEWMHSITSTMVL